MKVIAINGSPRKQWNTGTLLSNVLDGARSQGAATEIIHLYDYSYRGCTSCFSCKEKGGESYGKCAEEDDLIPLLEKVAQADALVLGSPVYFGSITGMMRCFLERLLFPYTVYDANHSTLFGRKIPTAFVYTMNMSQERLKAGGEQQLVGTQGTLKRIFGSCEPLYSTDTFQFDDYGHYESSSFDEKAKAKRHKEVFPEDCKNAYALGEKLAVKI
jgi:multimeric flavodoxin WrbA